MSDNMKENYISDSDIREITNAIDAISVITDGNWNHVSYSSENVRIKDGEDRCFVFETNGTHNRRKQHELMAGYFSVVDPFMVQRLVYTIERLKPFEQLAQHWQANHECEVNRARILKQRPDMPIERIEAYNRMKDLEEENKHLREEVSSLKNENYMQLNMIMCRMDMISSKVDENNKYLTSHFTRPGF